MPSEIHHIVDADVWARAVEKGVYVPESLETEGFVHFSTSEQLAGTLERYYQGVENLLVVTYDAAMFGDDLVYEATISDEDFPHVYAPLDPAAALRVEAVSPASERAGDVRNR